MHVRILKAVNLPSAVEVRKARGMLVETGLKTVIAQTTTGHLGP